MKERLSIPEKETLETESALQKKGELKPAIQPQHTLPSLAAYLETKQAFWYWATIATVISTVAVIFMVPENLYPLSYVRNTLGTLFVLWFPGYTLIKALLMGYLPAKTSKRELDIVVQIALSLAMSLALVPMIGLILNFTPFGIRLVPTVLSVMGLTLIFSTLAVWRECNSIETKDYVA